MHLLIEGNYNSIITHFHISNIFNAFFKKKKKELPVAKKSKINSKLRYYRDNLLR